MSPNKSNSTLPKNIEQYLAVVAKMYARSGARQLQEIVVNAQVRVHEDWIIDNWNDGTCGHALFLVIPESVFLGVIDKKDSLQKRIKDDLNKVHSVPGETVAEVFLEVEASSDREWRRESGVLLARAGSVPDEARRRIWGEQGFRLFLSHKSENKREAAAIKERLQIFGISSFVAHEDIHPTTAWQVEIENALLSMDAFVALLSKSFHDSDWTDQEVGFALCRGVPIIAVRLGRDPYGFIGKFQALSCDWDGAADQIVELLLANARMVDSYIDAVQRCGSFDAANVLASVLSSLDHLTDAQAGRLVEAFNNSSDIRGSFGFNGKRPFVYGDGLAVHLTRATGRKYVITSPGTIEVGT